MGGGLWWRLLRVKVSVCCGGGEKEGDGYCLFRLKAAKGEGVDRWKNGYCNS